MSQPNTIHFECGCGEPFDSPSLAVADVEATFYRAQNCRKCRKYLTPDGFARREVLAAQAPKGTRYMDLQSATWVRVWAAGRGSMLPVWSLIQGLIDEATVEPPCSYGLEGCRCS